jgi:putative glycosyltransferase (TIGR04372 family)
MNILRLVAFIESQFQQLQIGGLTVLIYKIKILFFKLFKFPIFIFIFPIVLLIRLIGPWYLVRFGAIRSSRIGHFAGNVELYLCERDAGINKPSQRHIDIFYFSDSISNQQLALMWKRIIKIWPNWIIKSFDIVNNFIPGGALHVVGNNEMHDQDVHSLIERFPCHLIFSDKENKRGEKELLAMGIPKGAQFICLNVRDSAYLHGPGWAYHNYRDSDINNYVLAANYLAEQGYFVIRMGAKVHSAMNVAHPRIIDYATNGMRNDFMDIYIGSKCVFCISTSTGWDAIPFIFRKPIAYVNLMPIGSLFAIRWVYLAITKHHILRRENRELSMSEIFNSGVAFCGTSFGYESKDLLLIENTPEEIKELAVEMLERLNGSWETHEDDLEMQQRFWEIFPKTGLLSLRGKPLFPHKRSLFGSAFLRNNRTWLK